MGVTVGFSFVLRFFKFLVIKHVFGKVLKRCGIYVFK